MVKPCLYNLSNHFYLTFISIYLVIKIVKPLYNYIGQEYLLASNCMLNCFIRIKRLPFFFDFKKNNNEEVKNVLARKNRNYIYPRDTKSPISFKSLKKFCPKRNIAIIQKYLKEYIILNLEHVLKKLSHKFLSKKKYNYYLEILRRIHYVKIGMY